MGLKLTTEFSTLPEAKAYLEKLIKSDGKEACTDATVGETRKGIRDWLIENDCKLSSDLMATDENSKESKAEQGKEPMVFIAYKGCPRMKNLRPTRTSLQMVNGVQQMFEVPGVTMITTEFRQDPGVRIIRVKDNPAVKRANEPISPEELSKMIQDTPEFDAELIVTWNEYQERKAIHEQKAKELEKLDQEYRTKLRAKRGKRGAA